MLLEQKVTRTVNARSRSGHPFQAYEIHMGETTRRAQDRCFAYVDGAPEGIECNRCTGTYLHGALEEPAVVEEYFGFRPPPLTDKAEVYDALANWFGQHADLGLFENEFLR
jgi:adenosylcobyric acid synthase